MAVLLVLAVVAFVVVSDGDGDGREPGTGGAASGGTSKAPAAVAGTDMPLLDGRLVVTAPPGWEEQPGSTADTAAVNVELRQPGRDLLGTLVTSALPGGGGLDGLLTTPDSTRFEVTTPSGALQGAAVPATGTVRAGILRPDVTFFLSLSVFALDGQGLDAPTLQKLFNEQVAPQLRFP